LIISFIQAVFSALFYFAAIAIYNGWLLVGYATFYTMAPVFSLVLDEDVSEDIAFQFPELYQELQKGRVLSIKTFFQWSFISVYQGGIIMLLAIFLFDASLYNIVSITFTVLVFTELFNIAFEIQTWHWVMVASEIATALLYIVSLFILRSYFDVSFILTWDFVWKVSLITAVTTVPIYVVRFIKRKCDPPAYTKLR
jgi:phospholipid-translocating ATPase